MNFENKKVEAVSTIPYQFTATPTNLCILLDVNCRSMLFTLIQLSSYYANEKGFFFRTNIDLQQESDLSQKLVNATIDTLYCNGIIDVISVGKAKGKQSNHFRINIEKIMEYEKYSMDELKNPELRINTADYREKGYSPKYLHDKSQEIPKSIPTISQNTNNIDIIESKENINNKEDVNSNIDKLYIDNIKEIEGKIKLSTSTIYLTENRENENFEIDENSDTPMIDNVPTPTMENRENEFYAKVDKLFEAGESIKEILITLSKTDWDCYLFCKKVLKENMINEYIEHRELIEELNNYQSAS